MRPHQKYPSKWVIAYKKPKSLELMNIKKNKKKRKIYIFYLIIFLQDFL